MSVEKLSDEVRTLLALAGHEGPTALRIIDQLTEALAAAERGRDSHYEAHVSAEQRALAAEARVRELEADQGGANRCIGELTAERDAANALLARVRASSRGRRWAKDIDAHLSAQPAALPCVSGYVGKNGECNDCGQHHAETTNAQWQQAARDAQSDLAVLRTEHAKLKARVEQACSALAEAHPDSQAVLLTMRVLRG